MTVRFGGVVALDGLSFQIDEGQICALIGPNGAGKTTLFNVVSRVYDPTSGAVHYDGKDLLSYAPHQIARVGVARTFQNLALWPGLSVLENVMVGMHTVSKQNFVTAALRLGLSKEERQLREKAHAALDELDLADVARHPAAGLPFGTLKRVELARAVVSDPRLLLLDEPASGLTHSEVDELAAVIKHVRDSRNLTVCWSSTTCRWSWASPTRSWCSTSAPRSPRGSRQTSSATSGSSRPTWGHRHEPPRRHGMTETTEPASGRHHHATGRSLLTVKDVSAAYGQVRVLHGIDLEVDEGEVVVVLGANGAGKTTTMRAICGMVSTTGSIQLDGTELVGKNTADIARLGVAHVPQGRGTFADLSVEDNLRLGAFVRKDKDDPPRHRPLVRGLPGPRRAAPAGRGDPVGRRAADAGRGPGDDGPAPAAAARRAVARARARSSCRTCSAVSTTSAPSCGMTMLVVEQNANLALGIADRGYVIEAGRDRPQRRRRRAPAERRRPPGLPRVLTAMSPSPAPTPQER